MSFESDGKPVSRARLLVRGVVFLAVAGVAATFMIAKSQGVFEETVGVVAVMTDVGDGLPTKSDVKYQGVRVGMVDSVTASSDGGPNYVRIDLLPDRAAGIPATVTARVVPSNVFAVPSVQLVNNGPGGRLGAGARIPQDQSLETVRLQTSLTALKDIVAAAGRSATNPTLGLLTTVEQATRGRGAEAVRAGGDLGRIVEALNDAMAPDGARSTLSALSDALAGLQASAPELLDAVHHSVVPLRAVEQQKVQLGDLVTGGLVTTGTVATALENNTGTLTDITGKISPPLGVIAEGSRGFTDITTAVKLTTSTFVKAWNQEQQSLTIKVVVELTPHRKYTRADCPRYGDLAGPSCATAPAGGPSIIGPNAPPSPGLEPVIGGNVGSVGSPQEQQRIASILGGQPNPAAGLLLGPLLRGNDVSVAPAPAGEN